jgi:hypothetical protein
MQNMLQFTGKAAFSITPLPTLHQSSLMGNVFPRWLASLVAQALDPFGLMPAMV